MNNDRLCQYCNALLPAARRKFCCHSHGSLHWQHNNPAYRQRKRLKRIQNLTTNRIDRNLQFITAAMMIEQEQDLMYI